LNASAAYTASVTALLERVDDVRQKQTTWGLSKELLIGTSDAGSTLSTSLATGIDFFMANVHPFFGNQPIQDAATWTWSFFENFNVVSIRHIVEISAYDRPLRRQHQTTPNVISPRLGGRPSR
jgi:exo-beta-1,3-glucanase (GH17 family)